MNVKASHTYHAVTIRQRRFLDECRLVLLEQCRHPTYQWQRLPTNRAAAVNLKYAKSQTKKTSLSEVLLQMWTRERPYRVIKYTDEQHEFLEQFASEKPSSHTPPRKDARIKRERRKSDMTPGESWRQAHEDSTKVHPYQREGSQVPDGGWLCATTMAAGGRKPPSSSSSSSSSDSSNSGPDSWCRSPVVRHR